MRFGLGPFAAEADNGLSWQEAYEVMGDAVVFAEDAGFDSAWVAERHFTDEGYCPSAFVAAGYLAARTTSIRLGVMPILGLTHPVYVAEDAATIDNASGGRLIVAPINAVSHEMAGYGVDEADYEARFRESVEVLVRAWAARPFRHHGSAWTIPAQLDGHVENPTGTVTVTPKPVQFELPLWIGGFWPAGRQLAAELALPMMLGAVSDNASLAELWATYDRTTSRLLRTPRVLIRDVFVTTSSDPLAECGEAFARQFQRYDQWGLWHGDASDIESLASDRLVVGNPDQVIGKIRALDDEHEIDHLICRMHFPGMRLHQVLASMSLFSREVIPEFKMPDLPRQIREGV